MSTEPESVAPARRRPTVIVARTVAPGREREVRRWFRRLRAVAREAPGFVGAEVQPPDALHPDEWVIVYQFDTSAHLDDWLASPERARVIDSGAELVVGEAREQVVALKPRPDPVTAVSSVRVRPGLEDRYRELHREVEAQLQTFDGFLRADLFEPVPGIQADTVVVFAFDTREHLDEWLRSDQRAAVLARMEPFVEGSRTVNVVGGFGGWFSLAGAPPVKHWKQAVIVLLALFPTALVLTLLREAFLPDVGLVLGVFLGNVAGVAVLSWILMPFLTKHLERWLRR